MLICLFIRHYTSTKQRFRWFANGFFQNDRDFLGKAYDSKSVVLNFTLFYLSICCLHSSFLLNKVMLWTNFLLRDKQEDEGVRPQLGAGVILYISIKGNPCTDVWETMSMSSRISNFLTHYCYYLSSKFIPRREPGLMHFSIS